jgi:hypothetical protein
MPVLRKNRQFVQHICDGANVMESGRDKRHCVHGVVEAASFHWLKFLDSAAPIGLGDIDIPFGIDRQSVAMGKFACLVTRTPEA